MHPFHTHSVVYIECKKVRRVKISSASLHASIITPFFNAQCAECICLHISHPSHRGPCTPMRPPLRHHVPRRCAHMRACARMLSVACSSHVHGIKDYDNWVPGKAYSDGCPARSCTSGVSLPSHSAPLTATLRRKLSEASGILTWT